MKILRTALLVTLLGSVQATVQAAPKPHSDLGKDFSISLGNPNGGWSYGFVPMGGDFLPFPDVGTTSDDLGNPVEVWFDSSTGSAIFHNANKKTVYSNGGEGVHRPGSVWFSAIPAGELAVARFTAPKEGKFNLEATFQMVLYSFNNKADVHVFVNGEEVFSDTMITGDRASKFHAKLHLQAGDTVDLAAGNSDDGAWGDAVFVDARIH